MTTTQTILEQVFAKAQSYSGNLSSIQQERIDTIVLYAESQKAVLAALITSLTKKLENPSQDIRQHKIELPGGYSGRVYDTQNVTPFIRKKFPRLAMKSGSGWLTRSIEQLHAFTLDFPGRIANSSVKRAFLEILHDVQENGADSEQYLVALFFELIRQQSKSEFIYERRISSDVSVGSIIRALKQHFEFNYRIAGASRLPVIAIYSMYELLTTSNQRYRNMTLLPLKSHTTSDIKSRSIGDIEVIREDNSFFEAVEIKHNIVITPPLVEDAFEKIESHAISRYYLLTTAEPNATNTNEIEAFIEEVRLHHGCEIIVNGVMPSLKYYLRLLERPADFVECYERNLRIDYESNTDVKEAHIRKWIEVRERLLPPTSR